MIVLRFRHQRIYFLGAAFGAAFLGAALAAFFAFGAAVVVLAFFAAASVVAIFLAVAALRFARVLLVFAVVMPTLFGFRLLARLVVMFKYLAKANPLYRGSNRSVERSSTTARGIRSDQDLVHISAYTIGSFPSIPLMRNSPSSPCTVFAKQSWGDPSCSLK